MLPSDNLLITSFYEVSSIVLDVKVRLNVVSELELPSSIKTENENFISRFTAVNKNLVLKIRDSFILNKFHYAIVAMYDKIVLDTIAARCKDVTQIQDLCENFTLEAKIFQTAEAGQKIFEDIVAVEQDASDYVTEMLLVYLSIINLCYSSTSPQITNIKTRICQKVYDKSSWVGSSDPFDCCGELVKSRPFTLKNNYTSWIVIAMSLFYLFSSSLLWLQSTGQISERVQKLLRDLESND